MYRETHSRIGVYSRIRGGRKGRQEIVVARCCFLASRADDTEYWSIVFQSHHRLNPCAKCVHIRSCNCRGFARNARNRRETSVVTRSAVSMVVHGRFEGTEGKLDRMEARSSRKGGGGGGWIDAVRVFQRD